jgi:hypothetical protein
VTCVIVVALASKAGKPRKVDAATAATRAELANLFVSWRRVIFKADGIVRPDRNAGICAGKVANALAEATVMRKARERSIVQLPNSANPKAKVSQPL